MPLFSSTFFLSWLLVGWNFVSAHPTPAWFLPNVGSLPGATRHALEDKWTTLTSWLAQPRKYI